MNRIVHTQLYSDKASSVLNAVLGQLSDGWWENSPAMAKYWMFASVKRLDDGEVVFEIDDRNYVQVNGRSFFKTNAMKWLSDDEVREFFGKKILFIFKQELKENGWNMHSEGVTGMSTWLSYDEDVPLTQVPIFAYHLLGNEKRLNKIFVNGHELRNELIGLPKKNAA